MNSLQIPATPTTYTLELTARCNSACIGCGNVFPRTFGDMGVERWRTILQRVQPHAVSLRITGGEATLHPQFAEIVRLVDDMGVPFVLFSNGFWHDADGTIRLLKSLEHLDGVLISLHGDTAAAHQAFTGTNTFERVKETIKAATKIDATTKKPLTINTNTVITRANFERVKDVAELSHSLGATFAAFSRYYGPPTPVTNLSEAEFRGAAAAVHQLRKSGANVQFNNCVPSCFDGKPTKSCPAGITSCTIDPHGAVRPCTHAPHVLGNLLQQPIEEIWQGEPAGAWRALIPPACATCAEFARCRGACKAMAYHMRQARDPLMQEPLAASLPARQPLSMQLYRNARPQQNFTLRREEYGYLLANRNQLVPVKLEAKPVLDAMDGSSTLQEIQATYGQPALTLVAYLFNKGLVRLTQ